MQFVVFFQNGLKKLLKYYKVKNFTIHNDLKIHKIRDVKACLIEAFFEQ